ncbi:Cytochrome b-c1 complex subunit 7, mitochondrial [Balamuthia mandrillaris]
MLRSGLNRGSGLLQNSSVNAAAMRMNYATAAGKQSSKGGFLASLLKSYTPGVDGYQQYGLLPDDLINAETDELQETLRRLPKDVLDKRQARIKRALDLNMKQYELPEEEWTRPEEEVPYLEPYLTEVHQEFQERRDFRK